MQSKVNDALAITSVTIIDQSLRAGDTEQDSAGESEAVKALEDEIRSLSQKNRLLSERGKQLAQELDVFRQRRLVYWSDRFRSRFDAWHLMHPAFEQLKDDTALFQGELKGFRLMPSVNLNRVNCLNYELDLVRPCLKAILFAPVVDMPSDSGEICMRIIGAGSKVLREVSVSLDRVSDSQPCRFEFPSLESHSAQPLSISLFVQNADVPVRIFELRKYPLFGFARIRRKLFCGFEF